MCLLYTGKLLSKLSLRLVFHKTSYIVHLLLFVFLQLYLYSMAILALFRLQLDSIKYYLLHPSFVSFQKSRHYWRRVLTVYIVAVIIAVKIAIPVWFPSPFDNSHSSILYM